MNVARMFTLTSHIKYTYKGEPYIMVLISSFHVYLYHPCHCCYFCYLPTQEKKYHQVSAIVYNRYLCKILIYYRKSIVDDFGNISLSPKDSIKAEMHKKNSARQRQSDNTKPRQRQNIARAWRSYYRVCFPRSHPASLARLNFVALPLGRPEIEIE